jgi:phosphonate transport system substrate-binding protein
MKKLRQGIAGVLFSGLFLFILTVENAAAEIKLGILPRLGAVELFVMFNPLAEYLSRETGEKVSIVIPKDFDAFKAAVRAGQVDMGFSNSLVYIQLRKDLSIEPLALSSELKAGTMFRGIIITRMDSPIKRVSDLKGKRMIFVEKDSAGGYLFQQLLLKKAGLDIKKDIELLPFAKRHDNVTLAVFNGAADAGGIREDDLAKMKDKVDLSKIRIVATSETFPNWPMFAAPGMNAKSAAKVKAALLKLKRGKPATARVLNAAKLDGFVAVSDSDYDKLRQAAHLVGAF